MSGDGRWISPPLSFAVTPLQRLRGLRPDPAGRGLLVRAQSVHGFGMRCALTVVGIDRSGGVCAIRRLRRRRIVVVGSATWLLELPTGWDPPPPHAGLVMVRRKLRP